MGKVAKEFKRTAKRIGKEIKRTGKRVGKEIKRTGKRVGNELDRSKVDILTGGATFALRETGRLLSGADEIEAASKREIRRQDELLEQQRIADQEVEKRRRRTLRASLSRQPDLFSVLGSPQGNL